ncbi:hypothetical protein H7U19_11655 [Hyunsoonleella sp. SJ7]|uniref:Uncharacterized protein n=1 Tax=Hyunsoonleella aquatilis TaxID=2762758 RepID=A0A923KGU1_9FLAO|nr:hypothetical protein [Hyunsoonleella aquatilis]MBC3759066.1 hypothetical protein [Hyunsoonleella aquatilis]
MRRKYILFWLLVSSTIHFYSQNKQLTFENQVIEHFKKQTWGDIVVTKDTLYRNAFKGTFNVSTSDDYIEFETKHVVIKNPYFSNKYEEAEEDKDYIKNFPRSFSVIYENSLVSLFENGKFACFTLDNFKRDTKFENKLNTKKFKYHWIIGNNLGGLSGNSIFIWDGVQWKKLKSNFPLKNQPKLFEDDKFIVHGDCHGEWGGTVYFFEKATSKTFFTESTCTNSIIKDSRGYNVLAHLGHGLGSSKIKTIKNPTELTLAEPNKIGRTANGQALGYTDKSDAFEKKLDFYGIQIFSSFSYQDKVLYIVHLSDFTFIAEIKNNEIEIVDPLFFSDLYTHDPVTNQYGKYTLMNLDHYGTGLNREISVLIFSKNKITKLDWNENHDD